MSLALRYDFANRPRLTDQYVGPDLSITRATLATVVKSDGLIHEVSSGVARFDGATYSGDTASGTSNGLLVEEARTNICLYSEDMSNAAWVASNVTKGSNASTAPDGSTTADRLTASAGNGTVLQSITSASADRSFAVYIKRVTGTGDIDLTVDGGSTWTTVAVDGTWTRFDIQQAAVTNPQVGFRIVTSADAIDVWGAQLEAGAFPTSYIPTTTASVTRNADDVLTTDVSPFNSDASGTYYVEAVVNQVLAGEGGYFFSIDDTGSSPRMNMRWNGVVYSADHFEVGRNALLTQVSSAFSSRVSVKMALGYATDNSISYVDGTASSIDSSVDVFLAAPVEFKVGERFDNAAQVNGLIKEIRYYNTRLTDAQLEALSNGVFPTDYFFADEWVSWQTALDTENFILAAKDEADGAAVWAQWQPGVESLLGDYLVPKGSATVDIDVSIFFAEASGTATWARWAPGAGLTNLTGALQVNLFEAASNGFALT